jgi:deazaflavin-dependent oxidoreductase (nitroreductase family)
MSRILYERTCGETDYRFGTNIADCTDHGDHVTTVLEDETTIDADVVVIAEGLRSQSRTLVTSAEVTDLGMYFAYLTLDRRDTDDQWWNWMQAPGHRAVHLRPDNLGTTRALLTFISDVRGLETLNRADHISILRRTFADIGGPAPRILAELDHAPMYFDAAGQFRSPAWRKGRLALLGDSAFCNATFGGAGTSLALIGAYVLAGELSGASDHPAALQRYERLMRPITDTAPQVRMGVLRLANPRTNVGIRTLHSGARLLASRPVQDAINAAGRRLVSVADDVALPNYGSAVDSSTRIYLAPSWWEKKLSNLFARANIAERLTVTGRISGSPRHIAVNTVEVDGTKYVVSARGESQWVKNVRVNPEVSLTVRGRTTAYTAIEVPADRRAAIVAAKFGKPGVGRFSAMLPDDADHPTFELTPKPLPRNTS